MQKLPLPEMWDICVKLDWKEDFVKSLNKFLTSHNSKQILDASGGTGFPSIELHKLGWNISYSDGSKQMFDFFEKKLKESNLKISHYNYDWANLQLIAKKFDTILCRGNSLVYVDSWEKNQINEQTPKHIERSLKSFFDSLENNGILYVDTINKNEFNKEKYPIITETNDTINGIGEIKSKWEIFHDYKNRIRTVKITLEISGKTYKFDLHSYLLKHEELVKMLKQVGFKKVEETNILGENHYTVFIAYK
ncbi:MAG: class I SAM-dependent methyltransferase [archaeon]|nr:class I SAM-dependent methyltransferase [archaeon]